MAQNLQLQKMLSVLQEQINEVHKHVVQLRKEFHQGLEITLDSIDLIRKEMSDQFRYVDLMLTMTLERLADIHQGTYLTAQNLERVERNLSKQIEGTRWFILRHESLKQDFEIDINLINRQLVVKGGLSQSRWEDGLITIMEAFLGSRPNFSSIAPEELTDEKIYQRFYSPQGVEFTSNLPFLAAIAANRFNRKDLSPYAGDCVSPSLWAKQAYNYFLFMDLHPDLAIAGAQGAGAQSVLDDLDNMKALQQQLCFQYNPEQDSWLIRESFITALIDNYAVASNGVETAIKNIQDRFATEYQSNKDNLTEMDKIAIPEIIAVKGMKQSLPTVKGIEEGLGVDLKILNRAKRLYSYFLGQSFQPPFSFEYKLKWRELRMGDPIRIHEGNYNYETPAGGPFVTVHIIPIVVEQRVRLASPTIELRVYTIADSDKKSPRRTAYCGGWKIDGNHILGRHIAIYGSNPTPLGKPDPKNPHEEYKLYFQEKDNCNLDSEGSTKYMTNQIVSLFERKLKDKGGAPPLSEWSRGEERVRSAIFNRATTAELPSFLDDDWYHKYISETRTEESLEAAEKHLAAKEEIEYINAQLSTHFNTELRNLLDRLGRGEEISATEFSYTGHRGNYIFITYEHAQKLAQSSRQLSGAKILMDSVFRAGGLKSMVEANISPLAAIDSNQQSKTSLFTESFLDSSDKSNLQKIKRLKELFDAKFKSEADSFAPPLNPQLKTSHLRAKVWNYYLSERDFGE